MEQTLVAQFDDDRIRFTPEGKVFVLDAIKALTQSEHPKDLWESLNTKYPEILAQSARTVVSNEGNVFK